MIYGLYLSANGMVTQGMRANTIANNLANNNTNGFKKDFLALRQRDPEVLRQGGINAMTQRHLLAIGGAVEGHRTHSIFTQGAIVPTGNPLDIAMNGSGFFKLQDPAGKVFYTRTGSFAMDQQGFLVAPNGFRAVSTEGNIIQIDPGATSVNLDEMGRVLADGEVVAQLAVVDVDEPGNLHKIGENMYEVLGFVNEVPANAQLRVSHVEASSVSAVKEMTDLIQAQRAYETNAKFIQIQDDTLGKALTQIAI